MNGLAVGVGGRWWLEARRGNALAIRLLLVVLVGAGIFYKASMRRAQRAKVEAQGGVMIAENDPELRAIREEARATFPEFETAFKNRDQAKTGDDAQVFAVKSGFRHQGSDDEEFMWIQVTNIMDTSITGIVVEEPFGNVGFHAGDTVTVNPRKIDDWYYTDVQGGEHGGKSNDVLMRRK